jgi:hypothetical protein
VKSSLPRPRWTFTFTRTSATGRFHYAQSFTSGHTDGLRLSVRVIYAMGQVIHKEAFFRVSLIGDEEIYRLVVSCCRARDPVSARSEEESLITLIQAPVRAARSRIWISYLCRKRTQPDRAIFTDLLSYLTYRRWTWQPPGVY